MKKALKALRRFNVTGQDGRRHMIRAANGRGAVIRCAKLFPAPVTQRTLPKTDMPTFTGVHTQHARVHELKCWPESFELIRRDMKAAEVRCNDRNYRSGDVLVMCEWDPRLELYTGRQLTRRVMDVLAPGKFPGIEKGFVMLSLSKSVPLVVDAALAVGLRNVSIAIEIVPPPAKAA